MGDIGYSEISTELLNHLILNVFEFNAPTQQLIYTSYIISFIFFVTTMIYLQNYLTNINLLLYPFVIVFSNICLTIACLHCQQIYGKLKLLCFNVVLTILLFQFHLCNEMIDKTASLIDIEKYNTSMNVCRILLLYFVTVTVILLFHIYRILNEYHEEVHISDHHVPVNVIKYIPEHIKKIYAQFVVINNEQCAMCLDNYDDTCDVHILNCGHHYHHYCFNEQKNCAYKC